ncbi:MAG TPA: hypothetical protein VFZ14_18725 [Burkholderiales bacterium]|nr:hypothetical protein [Burkholderiales bacterium]
MAESTHSLILDLLEWLGPNGRPYPEVIDAWHTSCPRLTVWEDASERGYIQVSGRDPVVSVSPPGMRFLAEHRGVFVA